MLVPAVAGLILVSYMVGERVQIDHDLRVVAPPGARPGASVPVRAFLYGGIRAIEGPALVAGRVRAQLLPAEGGQVLAESGLTRGLAGTYEGVLSTPPGVQGSLRMVVRARVGDTEIVAERGLRVAGDAPAAPPLPRALRSLQQLAPGPLRPVDGAIVPSALTAVVGGGACVPERRCRLLVHVGDPAAAVAAEPAAAVAPAAPEPAGETAGAILVPLTTHGPEATVTLRASRAGQPVARRRVRLPMALASEALTVSAPGPLSAGASARLRLTGEGPCILDAYRDGQWVSTRTAPDCDAGFDSPPLAPGLWRLQARRDPFAADSAAVLVLPVLDPPSGARPEPTAAQVRALTLLAAGAEAASAAGDGLVAQVRAAPSAFTATYAVTAQYLAAWLESGVVPQPPAVSGYDTALLRFAARRDRARVLTIVALGLSGLCLGLIVARRGLLASVQAQSIMASAGDSPDQNRRRGLLLGLRVLAVMLAILLAFVAVALYVVARGSTP